ncbi:cytochrome C [Caulobacter segnis]|uniref:Cytochrome c class I n=3 Tax=Caulobacter segnis TaxID=88688 RepID=D5VH29_CAUST|nr:cytochrome c [Caulobacter segnis]ADG10747.1 cytochrome c class I [Caulobacter segnis ATCC 21756]AVQ02452.1 cytochrome C [Caulobacter segnis]
MRYATLMGTLVLATAVMVGGALAQSSPSERRKVDADTVAGSPARGGDFARRECAGCHTVRGDSVSPKAGAPTFEEIAGRYVQTRLDWELEAITQVGHYSMPAKAMSKADIADVTAYIRSLKR